MVCTVIQISKTICRHNHIIHVEVKVYCLLVDLILVPGHIVLVVLMLLYLLPDIASVHPVKDLATL